MRTRHSVLAAILAALLAVAGVTAAIAANPPPPKIAFVANGRVPADALAAGPTAGQLGAPIYTTEQDSLPDATKDALVAYGPELVIVLGGPVAISDSVVAAISAATGLAVVDPETNPTAGVTRAAGEDRFATAAAIGDLLSTYNLAFLGSNAKAADSDKLDGMDSSAFLGAGDKAADSDELDGLNSSDFQRSAIWAMVNPDGTIIDQSGGITMADTTGVGGYYIDFGQDVSGGTIMVTIRYGNQGGISNSQGEAAAGVCGTTHVGCFSPGTNNTDHMFVLTQDSDGTNENLPFYITVLL